MARKNKRKETIIVDYSTYDAISSMRGEPIPPKRIQETEKRKRAQSRARRKDAERKEHRYEW